MSEYKPQDLSASYFKEGEGRKKGEGKGQWREGGSPGTSES